VPDAADQSESSNPDELGTMSQAKPVQYGTECSNKCGYLSVTLPGNKHATEMGATKRIKCSACGEINLAECEEP